MKIIDHPQRSEAWFRARAGLPTCSRFDKILTPRELRPASAQNTLIDILIAESLMPYGPEGFVEGPVTSAMQYGTDTEDEARSAYTFDTGLDVQQVGLVLSDCGRFGGSPDGLVGEDGGLEIKCPDLATHIGYVRSGKLPSDYVMQVHGSMVVTGRKWWDFYSYSPHTKPFKLRVEWSEITDALANELNNFCKRYNFVRLQFNLKPLGS